jgi:hypothetical protein
LSLSRERCSTAVSGDREGPISSYSGVEPISLAVHLMTVAVVVRDMFHRSEGPTVADGRESRSDDATEEAVDLLSDPHCRYLLAYLRRRDEPASVSTASRHVVAGITDSSPETVPQDVLRRVRTWFHHGQLPTLDSYGVIDFDPETSTVSLSDDSAETPG